MDLKIKTSQTLGKIGKGLSDHSPEIFFTLGTVSLVASVATAVSSTLKCEKVLDSHAERINKAKSVEIGTELKDDKTGEVIVYTEQQQKRVLALQYARTGWEFTKLYAPTIIFTSVAIGCFGASFGILKKRNAALAFSLSAVRTAYDEYRGRVVRDLGEEMDNHFLYDTVEKVVETEVTDLETGKTKKKKEKYSVPTKCGIYDQLLDESHDDYSKNSTSSYLAVRSHLLMANTLLRRNGHLYLNRMNEEFRFPETDALQAGIVYDPDKTEEERFIQIKGFPTVREAHDHTLYLDDSTMNQYWRDIADGKQDSYFVQFLNICDNIRDDVVRTDSSVRVIAGPTMD